MENIECILCNSREYFYLIESVKDRFNVYKQYQIQECRCGMILTNPRLTSEQIWAHYENDNYHPQKRKSRIFNFFYKIGQIFNNRSKKRLIHQYSEKGYFLDDKENGLWEKFHDNGIIREIVYYKKGLIDGVRIVLDKKGKLQNQENYMNNKFHGKQKYFHDTCKLKLEVNYQHGILEGNFSRVNTSLVLFFFLIFFF